MDNASTLHRIQEYLKKSPQIDSITIYSYASPEGPYCLNKRLATERGKTAKEYLIKHLPADRHIPDSLFIIAPTAENWQGLRELVFYQYPRADKEEVLAILDRQYKKEIFVMIQDIEVSKATDLPEAFYEALERWKDLELPRAEPHAPVALCHLGIGVATHPGGTGGRAGGGTAETRNARVGTA